MRETVFPRFTYALFSNLVHVLLLALMFLFTNGSPIGYILPRVELYIDYANTAGFKQYSIFRYVLGGENDFINRD